ncbi:prealbumin-like fold domain-containing protein [Actinokineospora sp. HUAS TT18]|uniref:prealbumin-like fold domain-containing protein n=1 Tax=Actinokineospora sp. HUAS TT18 TaxID=3447451 RepID=UPI003F5235B3
MSIRRSRLAVIPVAAMALVVGYLPAAVANLAGSPFDAGDGNLVLNDETQDWVNAPNLKVGLDKPTGQTDDSFGQGTKEDTAVPSVVSGSIPNNKSDLTRLYVANEKVASKEFLYLGWERVQEPNGTTNMDFEFNQNSALSGNNVTPVRTAGDVLIKYDLSQGGVNPSLGYHLWVTAGDPAAVCEANNSVPCWGKLQPLAGFFEGAINTAPVSDPIPPNAPRTLSARTFGEAAVNLTDSGILPAGVCKTFGSAYLKSRASDSFTAALKDFIAPVPVNISNCGSIVIHKVTVNGDSTFAYTTTGGLSPSTFNLSNGGTRTYTDVNSGAYTVTESAPPSGWTFESLVCTASGAGTSVTTSGATANITMAGDGLVDCTYTNKTKLSPTITTVLSATSAPVGSTVHDTATLSGASANAGGTATYTVYSDTGCSQNPQDAGTVNVTNGIVPNSNGITFNTAGTFYWQVVYSGDANNNPAISVCTSEIVVITKIQPGMTTAQTLLPNDSSTLTGATAGAGGSITFKLFSPADATCAGTPALTETVSVSGNGTYSTTNTTVFASTEGTWRWLVTYSGDANNEPTTSACGVENFTIDNG